MAQNWLKHLNEKITDTGDLASQQHATQPRASARATLTLYQSARILLVLLVSNTDPQSGDTHPSTLLMKAQRPEQTQVSFQTFACSLVTQVWNKDASKPKRGSYSCAVLEFLLRFLIAAILHPYRSVSSFHHLLWCWFSTWAVSRLKLYSWRKLFLPSVFLTGKVSQTFDWMPSTAHTASLTASFYVPFV